MLGHILVAAKANDAQAKDAQSELCERLSAAGTCHTTPKPLLVDLKLNQSILWNHHLLE